MNLEEKQRFLVNFAFLITIIGIVLISIRFLTVYLLPFVIGIIIAYIVQKPAELISDKANIKKDVCAALLAVLIYIALLLLLFLLFWYLYEKIGALLDCLSLSGNSLEKLVKNINAVFQNVLNKLGSNMQNASQRLVDNAVEGLGSRLTSSISNGITKFVKSFPTFFVTAVVTVVATCYISKDYDKLKKFLKGIIKPRNYSNIVEIKTILSECVFKLLLGYLLLTTITFFELLVCFLLLGIKNFIIKAIIISIIDLLPVFGAGTVLLPWSVLLFFQGDYKLGFAMVFVYILVSVVKNFAEPKIIGRQIGINPLFTLITMFLGLKLAGFTGMIVFPILLIVMFTFYRNRIMTEL